MTDEHTEPPSTIKEVGIHIGYMRDDISELKELMKNLPNGFASKTELTALETRVLNLEKRNDIKNTLVWVGLVATTLTSIFAIYTLFTK